jgi:hypothetical protein
MFLQDTKGLLRQEVEESILIMRIKVSRVEFPECGR